MRIGKVRVTMLGKGRPRLEAFSPLIAAFAEEGLRPPEIMRLLEAEAEQQGVEPPSERTVRRRFDEHFQRPEHERMQDAQFRYPASLISGVVPWADARLALDFLKQRLLRGAP